MEVPSPRTCRFWIWLVALLLLILPVQAQLKYELRTSDGGNLKARTINVGDTITLRLYAVVSDGTNGLADEGFQFGYGSILSQTQAGGLKGSLSVFSLNTTSGQKFNDSGSQVGNNTVDLNADGILDIGSNAMGVNNDFLKPRGGSVQTGGVRIGNATELLLGSVNFTVNSATLSEVSTGTSFNFAVPTFASLQRNSFFQVDGMGRNEISGVVTVGQAVTFSTGNPTVYWRGGQGSGDQALSWSTDLLGLTNFTTDAAGSTTSGTLPGLATEVIFNAANAGNLNTTLGRDFSIRKLTFNASATSPVTISGNRLTLGSGGLETQVGSGSHTINSNVQMAAAQTWLINSADPLTINGVLSGAFDLNKAGSGVLRLAGTSGNTFSGSTNISAGTVQASKTGALGNTLSVNLTGGTLLLGDTGSTGHRVRTAADVTLMGGNLASERAEIAANTITESFGVLTLTVDSTLDFGLLGSKGGNTSLTFADTTSGAWSGVLSVVNWQGNFDGTAAVGATSDHLYLTNAGNLLTNGQLAQIRFFDGTGGMYSAKLLGNEIVANEAIPEPSVIAAALLLVGGVCWRERRRFSVSRLFLRRQAAPQC